MSLKTPAKDAYLQISAKTPLAQKKSVLWFMKSLVTLAIVALILGVFRVYDMQSDNFMTVFSVVVFVIMPPLFIILFAELSYMKKVRKAEYAYCKEYAENLLGREVTVGYKQDGRVTFKVNGVVLCFYPETEEITFFDGRKMNEETLALYYELSNQQDQQ